MNSYYNQFGDIINMLNLLREGEENTKQRGQTFTLTNENDFFKEQTARIREFAAGAMIVFNPISIDYNLNNVEWLLKINGQLELLFKISNDDTGVFMSGNNIKINQDLSKTIARLEGFFREEFLNTVLTRLESKDF